MDKGLESTIVYRPCNVEKTVWPMKNSMFFLFSLSRYVAVSLHYDLLLYLLLSGEFMVRSSN